MTTIPSTAPKPSAYSPKLQPITPSEPNTLHVAAIVEWNFMPEWSANIGVRTYRDSGEIQSSGFNALAPPVHSSEIFGGLTWDRGDLAVSAGIGFLESDYDPLSEDNEFFGNLYKDRDWLTVRLAAAWKF